MGIVESVERDFLPTEIRELGTWKNGCFFFGLFFLQCGELKGCSDTCDSNRGIADGAVAAGEREMARGKERRVHSLH